MQVADLVADLVSDLSQTCSRAGRQLYSVMGFGFN